jgi:hypothetical protein
MPFVLPSDAVATTVIGFCAGGVAGAVYNPVALILPIAGFPALNPVNDHVTAVFVNPVTAALNCVVEFTPA